MLFSIWYVFRMAGTGCLFLCIVPFSGALVKQAWWWQNLWVLACLQRILFFLHLWSFVWLDMKFWVKSFFLYGCLILAPTLSWLVEFLPRDLLWVWWASLCGWPDLSPWLPFLFSPAFQPWWIWRLYALGLLFLRNIFVVFSVFPGHEYWPTFLGWGNFPGQYPE